MAKASKEIIQKHEQMFYPTVRVRTKKAGGSGTVVYSKKHKDEVYTYVITNHHVIADSVSIQKKWDPVLKRKVDKEKLDTVSVEFFRYNNYSHTVGSFAVEADIVAYSEVEGGQDWALLRVRDRENLADYVANLFPLNDIDNVHIFDEVYAVGASLGHPPVASDGHISYMDDEIDHIINIGCHQLQLSLVIVVEQFTGGILIQNNMSTLEYLQGFQFNQWDSRLML